jgi:hypothetical protein
MSFYQMDFSCQFHLLKSQMASGGHMATLSELVDVVAAMGGLEPVTVNLFARSIREAGLIATGGRGSSAATMSPKDAANLLIAINASGTAREGPEIVAVYRRLEAQEFTYEGDPPGKILGTFGEGLETLIDAACRGEFPQQFLNRAVPDSLRQEFATESVNLGIRFMKPEPSAYVTMLSNSRRGEGSDNRIDDHETWEDFLRKVVHPSFVLARMRDHLSFSFTRKRYRKSSNQLNPPDRTEEITIGSRTIFAVARALRRTRR